MSMNKSCGNCNNYIWSDGASPLPQDCIRCVYVEVKGEKQPSNWRAKPKTNADRIRSMSDEELAAFVSNAGCPDHTMPCIGQCEKCVLRWLQQPPKGE